MSRLEELIKKLCSRGVEFLKLGNICEIKTGKGLTKSDCKIDGKYPIISGGVSPLGYYNNFNRNENNVTIARAGNAGFVNFINTKFWCNDKCFSIIPLKNNLNTKYMYYYLKNMENEIMELKSIGIVSTVNTEKISNIKIPIPPLEVQNEVVHILDKFTALSEEISEELKLRQKQFEYYKEKLLKFSKNNSNVNCVCLGEYCTRLKGTAITAGKMKEIALDSGNVRIFAGGKTKIDTDERFIKMEDIIKVPNIIVQSRGIIDFIYYDKPCSFKREMWSYTNDSVITLKYIYYYLKNNIKYFRQRGSQMGSMPQISLDLTEKFKIPVPALEEQEKIVNILDKFDKLCNSILEGLPAEIEARQKQYEYYRDKLLNFRELKIK